MAAYHVDPDAGDDSNDGSEFSRFEHIQKAISVAMPGDVVFVYQPSSPIIESTASSAWTVAKPWFGAPSSLCLQNSGTKEAPIIIAAHPSAAEGSVVIDGEDLRCGVMTDGKSYVTFFRLKFINNFKYGIVNTAPDSSSTHTTADSIISTGVRVLDCTVDGVITDEMGDNIGCIGPWGTKDWVIDNCLLRDVAGGSGIRAYGAINCIVQHNKIEDVDEGVLWKDHFTRDDDDRGFYIGSRITRNNISARKFGVNIQTRGSGSCEAGHHFIHHNVFHGFTESEAEAVHYLMGDAGRLSGNLRVFHNTCDMGTVGDGVSMSVNMTNGLYNYGNVFARFVLGMQTIYVDTVNPTSIKQSDYNVFMGNNSNLVVLDRYSPPLPIRVYNELTDWQAALASQSVSLTFDNPDQNSVAVAYSGSYFDSSNPLQPLKHAGANPAIGMMPGGRNAGAYEYGDEIVGRVPFASYKVPASRVSA